VSELDKVLRKLDKDDPVKYDFALFGLSVSERFLIFIILNLCFAPEHNLCFLIAVPDI
jgi:hypothetical protein